VREAGGERARIAREACGQMLNEVDLVDVSELDRLPDTPNRRGVVGRAPGLSPGAKLECFRLIVVIFANILLPPDSARSERQRAWFRRLWGVSATDRGRQPVAEVQVCHEVLSARGKEAVLAQPRLDAFECPFGLVDLDRVRSPHGTSLAAATSVVIRLDIELLGTAGATLPSV
jgi:hypothetical protein